MILHLLLTCSLLVLAVSAAPASVPDPGSVSTSGSKGAGAPGRDIVTWNQSQHGKYNVHVSLKDVKIIAVLNSDYYDDEDNFEYDYEDLEDIIANATANKPPNTINQVEEEEEENDDDENSWQISQKPASSTAKPPATEVAPETTNTTSKPVEIPAAHVMTFVADGKPENISQLPNDPAKRNSRPRPDIYHRHPPSKSPLGKVKCETGYTVDRLGRCRKIRRRRPSLFPFKFDFPSFRGFRIARLSPLKHETLPEEHTA